MQSVANDEESQSHIATINEYRASKGDDAVEAIVPELPFPRVSYCDAISTIKQKGGKIEWDIDIDAENSDLLAEDLPHPISYQGLMALKLFYIHHIEGEDGSMATNCCDDLNGRDELTSGGQREHRMDTNRQSKENDLIRRV